MAVSAADTLFVNTLFSAALQKKATDIHLMAGNYPVLRLDTALYAMTDQKIMNVELLNTMLDTFLSADEKQRLTAEREVKTVYTWADRARFRVQVYYQQGYPALSFRQIPTLIPGVEELGIPEVVITQLQKQQGLILLCGPFNSGRTTTMASLLQYLNLHASKRIESFEQPIEHMLVNSKSMINQREVGKDTPSFVVGLANSLDDDVEVVAVSAMNEPGVYEQVLNLAEGGKLVIAIMNTNSAVTTLEKFLGSIPHDKLHWAKDALSHSLLAIMNQRLVTSNTGGRTLVLEVMTMTPAVASMIQENNFAQLPTVMQTSRDEGMVALDYRLQELVRMGKVSADEARKAASDPSLIRT
jgi:twitching motility protein PilT